MYYDTFDICLAYYQLEVDYNCGGWLHERKSNQRRREATHVQLYRMKFRAGAGHRGYESLSDNAKEIYHNLRVRYGFDKWDSWEWIDSESHEDGGYWLDNSERIDNVFSELVGQ